MLTEQTVIDNYNKQFNVSSECFVLIVSYRRENVFECDQLDPIELYSVPHVVRKDHHREKRHD